MHVWCMRHGDGTPPPAHLHFYGCCAVPVRSACALSSSAALLRACDLGKFGAWRGPSASHTRQLHDCLPKIMIQPLETALTLSSWLQAQAAAASAAEAKAALAAREAALAEEEALASANADAAAAEAGRARRELEEERAALERRSAAARCRKQGFVCLRQVFHV